MASRFTTPPRAGADESPPAVLRPHGGWWVSVLLGMSSLGVLVGSERAYGLWASHVTRVFPRWLLALIFLVAVALHLGEAIYARRLAHRIGGGAGGWFWQTLALGYPSLRLLRMQAARHREPAAAGPPR